MVSPRDEPMTEREPATTSTKMAPNFNADQNSSQNSKGEAYKSKEVEMADISLDPEKGQVKDEKSQPKLSPEVYE